MNRYVKNLREYLTESLNQMEWLNYKADSALNSPNPSEDVLRVAAFVQGALNVDDASALLFTGADVSIGEDYAYFIDEVIPKSTEEKDKSKSYEGDGYTAFCTVYKNGDKFFAKADIRSQGEFSYIFIRQEDYEYFDTIDAPVIPQIQQKTQPQAAQAEAPGLGASPPGGGLL